MASQFKNYQYISDTTGVTVNIRIKGVDGDAVGNVSGNFPVNFHISRSKLRKIDGVCLTTNPPTRRRIVICDPANARWATASPATFTIAGLTYTVVGRIGEKRF